MTDVTSTNYTELSYELETTAGTTNTPYDGQILPVTSNELQANIETAMSEVIRSDRQTDDLIPVDYSISGNVGYEVSYAPYKPLMISLLQSASPAGSVDATSNNVSFGPLLGDTQTITDGDAGGIFSSVVTGMYVRISGASDLSNNGVLLVASAGANVDTISVVNPNGVQNASDTGGVTIAGTSYRNGAAEPDSYTFRKKYTVLGAPQPDSYFYYGGCQIGMMNFNFETGSILNGDLSIVGLNEALSQTPLYTDTTTPIPDYDIMNSVSSVVNVELGGLPATTEFNSMDIAVNNNINEAKAIGSIGAVDLASFTLDVGGAISLYFENLTIQQLFAQSGDFSFALTLQDVSGNQIVISAPKCKFEELQSPVSGKDEFLFSSGSWKALRDPVNDYMLQFTFIDAL